ncbi:MAG: outer membrane protein assembly factor BamD [Alphaproteobacteria bacterium]|jgi:outer membrane protein assembly factor BamD|nr:outer membrane protein assembly factor BamD [Alphaproteobacteria bacterium]
MSFADRLVRFGAALLIAAPLAACAGDEDRPRAEMPEIPPEQIYSLALTQLDKGNWIPCAQAFDEVERQHPYSVWARRAILMSAFCYYQGNKYNEAILASDRFITLHPGNKDAPYAYYLKAVSLYEQIVDVGRDQRRTEQAMAALGELVRRFPQTDYARDARLKLDLTKDHLAGKEMAIGRYYLRRGEELAAISRFRTVVEKYQTTSHVPEALHRLVEAYLQLGIVGEARTAAAVLGHNYPGTDWYEDSYTLMAEYGKEPRGKPVMQAKVGEGREVTPVAQPAPGTGAVPVSAPAATAVVPPPAELKAPAPEKEPEAATTATDTIAPEPKKEDDEGGFFDWF